MVYRINDKYNGETKKYMHQTQILWPLVPCEESPPCAMRNKKGEGLIIGLIAHIFMKWLLSISSDQVFRCTTIGNNLCEGFWTGDDFTEDFSKVHSAKTESFFLPPPLCKHQYLLVPKLFCFPSYTSYHFNLIILLVFFLIYEFEGIFLTNNI